jgi:pilus assembly protein FimV
MSVTMPRVKLMACLLCTSLLAPCWSWALGLGEIHLNSALNEPLNADIDLIAASPDELTALRATLASREAFTRYGIDRPAFLSSITFKVGKGKDGRDSLLVRSSDSVPEPFVTFLVEVNWARGRLMREYTVLLDPPVYTPGETAKSAAPVAAPVTSAPVTSAPPPRRAAPPVTAPAETSTATTPSLAADSGVIRVGQGDTLTRIARGLQPDAPPAVVDQTMIALYRSNPDAFGGNINILRQGAILRVPNADQIAALNQRAAISEVHRQIEAWRAGEGAAPGGHLRLVTPLAGGSATGAGSPATASGTNTAETLALRQRVKDLEGQLAESKRLIDIRNSELSALQKKLGVAQTSPPPAPPPPAAVPPAAKAPPAITSAPPPAAANPVAPPPPVVAVPPATAPKKPAPPPVESGSWTDWLAANWWVAVAVLVAVLAGLGFAALRRRRQEGDELSGYMAATDIADSRDSTSKLGAPRKPEAIVVEESGQHAVPDFPADSPRFGDTGELKSPDDTLSSENAVNLDQGDPLAEADFHMAYGLYDQAADLVRIALEREPDRRDLRLKLLEIYFVWGNKDAFLQTAKGLEATRERAPAGEWDKILIMGKQICPEEPMFGAAAGSGRGAGTLVDLNLEGGENRVDIDLFGDPEGERSSLDHSFAKDTDHASSARESQGTGLDFTLDAPERGADDSPTREMPPRDEPTVESELMEFGDPNFMEAAPDAPTTESPALRANERRDYLTSRLPAKADQTAEVSIDDLGLDLDSLEQTGAPSVNPGDTPTLVSGMDERSRRMLAEADAQARDRDLTELERELEASFVSDLDASQDDGKTAILGPESSPTVLMAHDFEAREFDQSPTSRFKSIDVNHAADREKDLDSTSRLHSVQSADALEHSVDHERGNGLESADSLEGSGSLERADSIDLDLDRLASALGSGDTVEQPRAAEDLFSAEVFDATRRTRLVDLDVGEALHASEAPTNKLQAQTNKLKPLDLAEPELEPVTMSEVGTKLDLARAYMDMGDPEGARSILEEVVLEGSASQKQEASRLIESLPG